MTLNRIIFLTMSIPAYAGEPHCRVGGGYDRVVYPRVCGGTVRHVVGNNSVSGLSPRMRGNLRKPAGAQAGRRSIPAYAGEPRSIDGKTQVRWVYPRVCGGTKVAAALCVLISGLSPRMRGNRFR